MTDWRTTEKGSLVYPLMNSAGSLGQIYRDRQAMMNQPSFAVSHPNIAAGSVSAPYADDVADRNAIIVRLSALGGHIGAGCDIHVKRLENKTRVVLVTNGSNYSVIEDGPELFPSDDLMVKLRLIL